MKFLLEVKTMALELTSEQIKEFIRQMNCAKPYSHNETSVLDDRRTLLVTSNRSTATRAKRILDGYFKEHPEDSIENYI